MRSNGGREHAMGKRSICSSLVIPNWGMTRAENKHLFPSPPAPPPLFPCSLPSAPLILSAQTGRLKGVPSPTIYPATYLLTPPFPQAPLRSSLRPSTHFRAPHPSRSGGAGALHPGWAMPDALLSHRRCRRTAHAPPSWFTHPAPPKRPPFTTTQEGLWALFPFKTGFMRTPLTQCDQHRGT